MSDTFRQLVFSDDAREAFPVTSNVCQMFSAIFRFDPNLGTVKHDIIVPVRSQNVERWQTFDLHARNLSKLLMPCIKELVSTCGMDWSSADRIVRPIQSACWIITGQAHGYDPFADPQRTGHIFSEAGTEWVRLVDIVRHAEAATGAMAPPDKASGDPDHIHDPIEDALTGQALKLYRFLKGRSHFTSFDTLREKVGCWQKDDVSDDTIKRALERLSVKLSHIDAPITVTNSGRRTMLEQLTPATDK